MPEIELAQVVNEVVEGLGTRRPQGAALRPPRPAHSAGTRKVFAVFGVNVPLPN